MSYTTGTKNTEDFKLLQQRRKNEITAIQAVTVPFSLLVIGFKEMAELIKNTEVKNDKGRN